jgi:arsenite-transporting ATPase
VRAARAGRRTVLLTRLRPGESHGLAEVPGLEVTTVDPRAALERLWAGVAGALGAVLPQLMLPPETSVLPLPGTAEFALFTELAGTEADLVVVDAGPLEAAAALVALPATLRWWLDRLLPPGVRALGAVRTAAVASGAARRGPVDAALSAVPVLEGLLARDRLADTSATAVCLVALPRPSSVPALRSTATMLALAGHRAATVLVRVPPVDSPGEWWTRRSAEQDGVVRELTHVAAVQRVPELAVAPGSVDELAALLDGVELPDAGAPAVTASERRDGSWQLTLPLPFAHRADVDLTRWNDDLVVTVGAARRCLPLDALLRRCEVTGGRLADPGTATARLEVGFRPDPQLWPPDLLAAETKAAEERTP